MRRGPSPEGKIPSQGPPEGFQGAIECDGQDLFQGRDIIFRPVSRVVPDTEGFGQV